MSNVQKVIINPEAVKIFLFEEVYPATAAKGQAEKKKLNAFGKLAKLNPLKRPKEETVLLCRHEMRLEPFWLISATKVVDYTCQVNYPLPIQNSFAQKIVLDDKEYEVTRSSDNKAKIDISVTEKCHKKIHHVKYIDGLKRKVKESVLENYCSKYKFSELDKIDREDFVKPLLPKQAIIEAAKTELNKEAINAHEFISDELVLDKVHLFLVPVFAFEFAWQTADKVGVMEVNGLTGDIIEDGQWFKDKMENVLTREMLIEAGSEVAASLVPGAGLAVKVVGKLTE